MQESTSGGRKSFRLFAGFGLLAVVVTALGVAFGASPAMAASLVTQSDTQVAVFMVPLTLLVLVLLFEVARFAWRGRIPTDAPTGRARRLDWAPARRRS